MAVLQGECPAVNETRVDALLKLALVIKQGAVRLFTCKERFDRVMIGAEFLQDGRVNHLVQGLRCTWVCGLDT